MERWRDVPGFPGYQVSDLGRVRSWRKRGAVKPGGSRFADAPVMKSPSVDRDGYLKVRLHSNGASKNFSVHRLVLDAFIGPCPDGMEARHVLNNDPADCRLANLRWGTHTENIRDRHAHGTTPHGSSHPSKRHPDRVVRGESCGQSKLTEEQVRSVLASNVPSTRLGPELGVSSSTIRKIRNRKNWSHLEV